MTTVWLDADSGCPDADGVFDGSDNLVNMYPQVLDLTTDGSSADWMDLDADGCCVSGSGPASSNGCGGSGPGGLSSAGTCLDIAGGTVSLAYPTSTAESGGPFYDVTQAAALPFTVSGPATPLGASCGSPPTINFGGTATRCIP